MKDITGWLLIVIGVIAGLWVGVWWGFIGGIIQTVEAFRGTPIEASDVAFGIARIVFASLAGWGTALCFWFVGLLFTAK